MDFGMPFLLETPDLESCCRLAHELGLKFVEINASFPECLPTALDADRLKQLMQQYQLYFTLHMDESFDPFASNIDIRRAWQQQLRVCLRLAKDVGMPIVNMHIAHGVYITLPTKRVYIHQTHAESYQHSVDELYNIIANELADSHTRLCIENTDGFQAHEQQAIEKLLTLPQVGLTLDLGHMHCIQGKDEPFFQRYVDCLRHMHGHDAAGNHPHLALGDGDIDLPARFTLAQRCGARIVLETKTINALKQSLAWLHTHMPHLGA